jgi:Domain of Unknown Function (DUF928)
VKIGVLCLWISIAIACSAQQPQRQQPPPKEASQPSAAASETTPAKHQQKRVHIDLKGFELDKTVQPKPSTQVGGGTRDIGGATVLLAPRLARVYTAYPIFDWTHSAQAQNFEFRLFDNKGSLLYKSRVTGREFHYPADAPPLQPDTSYEWSVQPEVALLGGASDKSSFVRIPGSEIAEVSAALDHVGDADEMQLAQRAQIFTDHRLWFDALAAYSNLIKHYPYNASYHEKRGEIYDQLSVTGALAEEDFAMADKLREQPRP